LTAGSHQGRGLGGRVEGEDYIYIYVCMYNARRAFPREASKEATEANDETSSDQQRIASS
jgi:hypothetical protein